MEKHTERGYIMLQTQERAEFRDRAVYDCRFGTSAVLQHDHELPVSHRDRSHVRLRLKAYRPVLTGTKVNLLLQLDRADFRDSYSYEQNIAKVFGGDAERRTCVGGY